MEISLNAKPEIGLKARRQFPGGMDQRSSEFQRTPAPIEGP